MGGDLLSIVSRFINVSMIFIIMSILASCELGEEGCLDSLSFLLYPSSLIFSLVEVKFISTSMPSFIISIREADFLSLIHQVNSLSKSSAYWG